jgi:exopolyphosphatase/guanosine-5'-triphosphate,3'-diphosphate pyrophosphatase
MTKCYKSIIFLVVLILNISFDSVNWAEAKANSEFEDKCIVQRAVFELGSGVTTIALAKVNKCNGSVVDLQKQVQKKISFQDHINTSKDGATLSKEIIEEGITKIQEAKTELGINCDNVECRGIATAAMRSAKNSNEVLEEIYKKTQVKAVVISQKEEGLVGYHSAMIKAKLSKGEQVKTMVLDIGGGSYQVIYPDQDQQLVYSGMIGSAVFKSMVIELIKNNRVNDTDTPNPMTNNEVVRAKLLSKKSIGEPIVGVDTIKQLVQSPDIKLYGIGSFLKSIAKTCDKDAMKIEMNVLTKLIDKLTLKDDAYIKATYKNPYFNEMVTNLVFVHGIMKALNIKTLPIMDVNNTLGALVSTKYW